jgi:multisubunit Na+/H+ antiporter MnhG subunit
VPVIVDSLFSSVVIMALVTTLLTPVFLHWLARSRP